MADPVDGLALLTRPPQRGPAAHLLQGLRPGRAAGRVRRCDRRRGRCAAGRLVAVRRLVRRPGRGGRVPGPRGRAARARRRTGRGARPAGRAGSSPRAGPFPSRRATSSGSTSASGPPTWPPASATRDCRSARSPARGCGSASGSRRRPTGWSTAPRHRASRLIDPGPRDGYGGANPPDVRGVLVPGESPSQPGWYPDQNGTMRWFDGASWTDHVQPGAAAPGRPAPSRRWSSRVRRRARVDSGTGWTGWARTDPRPPAQPGWGGQPPAGPPPARRRALPGRRTARCRSRPSPVAPVARWSRWSRLPAAVVRRRQQGHVDHPRGGRCDRAGRDPGGRVLGSLPPRQRLNERQGRRRGQARFPTPRPRTWPVSSWTPRKPTTARRSRTW